jgi:hypothetical protein
LDAHRQSVCKIHGVAIPRPLKRLDAGTGAVAAVLFLVAFALPGLPPRPDESTATVAEHLRDHRSAILAGDVLIAFASAVFLWFLGSLWGYLRAGGEDHMSTAAALGSALGTAIIAAGAALQAALVLNSVEASAEVVRFGFDAYNALITIAGAGLAVGAGAAAVSGARSGALPSWAIRTGLVAALLQLLTLGGLVAEGGFFAAGGLMAWLAFLAIAAWFIAVSLLMVRRV